MTCAGKDLNNEHKSRIYHLLPEDSLMKCPVWVSGACLFTASCSCTGMHYYQIVQTRIQNILENWDRAQDRCWIFLEKYWAISYVSSDGICSQSDLRRLLCMLYSMPKHMAYYRPQLTVHLGKRRDDQGMQADGMMHACQMDCWLTAGVINISVVGAIRNIHTVHYSCIRS